MKSLFTTTAEDRFEREYRRIHLSSSKERAIALHFFKKGQGFEHTRRR